MKRECGLVLMQNLLPQAHCMFLPDMSPRDRIRDDLRFRRTRNLQDSDLKRREHSVSWLGVHGATYQTSNFKCPGCLVTLPEQ